ncbi:MAG: hypothetical protein WAL56_11005 [Candidatus Sulfotelmatobacter sp.]
MGRFKVETTMEMIFCPNCGKLTGFKRALGFGTFFAVLITGGLWLLAIPFYPKRCITCGLGKTEAVPWHQTWRLAAVLLAGAVMILVVLYLVSRHRSTEPVMAQSASDAYSPEQGGNIAIRNEWRLPSLNLENQLDHTLADAPFTVEERSRILKVIERFAIDEKQQVDRETLMSARVGSISLAEDGSQQILVQGPYSAFCGASGNCPMWIFTVDHSGQFNLALEMFGSAIIVRNTSRNGFRDFATSSSMGAYEQYIAVYRWSGAKYEQVDCYTATVDSDHSSSPPVVADCRK